MLKIIEKTKIWLSVSLIIIIIGVGAMFTKGFNWGIDFAGGTKVVIEIGENINKPEIEEIVSKYAENSTVTISDNTAVEIRASELEPSKVKEMFNEVKEKYSLEDTALVSEDQIGASIGEELTKNAIIAIGVSIIGMLVYIAIRFKLNYGIAAIIALLHDVLITISVYAIFQIPINTPFIAAVLTILGYSINDTIVIFDRIRENNKLMRRADAVEIADKSITDTFSRSINTTLTTLFTIVAVNIFVPTVREFTFPLIVGIASGAYSSIFIASPVWVMLKKKTFKINETLG